ncbi:multi-sensor hybrid histidine kinase : Multi-sensor hybrid histidine kinase OS=Chthoniobacter flavus Ellin428 GN=CfE428DRAFT_6228 PE=4 SV=1: Response_reg: GAF: PAS_9: GAF_2: PAS_3: PAS_9: HisKA: HATPase_c: Response_reg [Gemmata massiliana]|uniref:histidine kinase n=1 Tax=Gemmata massiliana TaxID=1210884 RepID=A0A6P2CXP7_9BACT|nr:PAS domain S-box protein [Gemmata massiliana]VTR92564.1 multi-sensor hybrid histidine kinase : Multi-sensor hybrid histidine kinase OS=Chthoniobacter flavus Ellin428 GN=CfE428DRAFT_6228 PE=4 SV=1: Response_reg: GAF: PAS_9: GAF_2: PAS_3: PAS_9: HisKA: HATPase_c: Response_reg [Gemmata massiliana]
MPDSSLGRLLIVDDEIELLNSLADKLAKQGYETVRFSAPRDALLALESETFDLLLTDLMMPGMDGIALLQAARRIDPELAGIVMTGQATVQTAVDAMKTGALDYVLKPFKINTILPALARALEVRRLRRENIQLRETVGIYELCNAISFTLDHPTLLNKVVDAALQQCEAEEASVMLPTETGDELRVAAIRGEGRGYLIGERVFLSQGIAGWVARHGESVAISGTAYDPRFAPVQPRTDIRFAISMPMLVGGKLIGVLNVNSTSRRRAFTPGQVKALSILANTGAAALESARLHTALRRAEEQYRSIFENASEGILQSTPDGQVQIANPEAARMLGYDSTDDLVTNVRDLGAQVYEISEDRTEVVRLLEERGRVRDLELPMVRKDGTRIWVSLSGRAVRDQHGKTLRYESTLGDITRRKQAEWRSAAEHHVARILAEAPSLTEALSRTLRALGEDLGWEQCAMWRVDPQDRVLRCAEIWRPQPGARGEPEPFSRSATLSRGNGRPGRVWALGQTVWVPDITVDADVLRRNPAEQTEYRGAVAFPILVGADVLGVIELFSREVRPPDPALLGTLDTVGNQLGVFIERRRAEEERDRFFELSVDMLCVIGFDGRFQIVNPAWATTLGWPPEEFSGRPYTDLMHPDDRGGAGPDALAAGSAAPLSFENRYRCADGSYKWLSWRAVTDPARRVVYASARDTTAKRQVEAELQLRDRAVRAVTQGILIADAAQPDNPIIYATPGFERMTGYGVEEVLGRNCRFLQGPDTDRATVSRLREAIRVGESCSAELLNYRKDRTPFWNDLSVAPVRDETGRLTHFVGVLTDVTSRRHLETQLHQSQKMDAIGRLAGGVAHDFNNLLTVINGYSDLLLERLPAADPNRELVAEIYHAGECSAGLTRQLLAFSRQQILAPRVLDLSAVVADTERMLRRLIGEDIRLSTASDPGLWAVRADPGQIEQVLLNLAVNARDAMPRGGQLTIEIRNIELDAAYTRTHPDARSGPHVQIAVSDTGCGMSPEVMGRIFEPFYTTKDLGKGTGLGLSTVHGIVKQSGGHLGVYSEVGVGTTFKVYLPRVNETGTGPQLQSGPLQTSTGTETILLVEDEDRIRSLSQHILVGCGYAVLAAANGDEAAEVAAGHEAPIHLLVTDVVMPGAGGRTVAASVAKHHPGVRVLFVSGYTDDAVVRHGVLEAGVNFLQKPFSPAALAQKVRAILDGGEGT